MVETKVAKRYAKSLLDLAKEKGAIDAINNDMKLFTDVIKENHDLLLLLENPIISGDKKLAILHQIFRNKIDKITSSFFEIVVKKGREKYLNQIAKDFINQYKTLKGIQSAEIISAVGLDDKLRKQVYDIIRKSTNSEIELVEKVNKDLIGGFVLRVGDKQYDASISSSLRKLTQAFSKNPYIKNN